MVCLAQTVCKDHEEKRDRKDQTVTQVMVVLKVCKELLVYLVLWAPLVQEEKLEASDPSDQPEPRDEVAHKVLSETLVPKGGKVSQVEKVQRETRDGEDCQDMLDLEEQTVSRELLDLTEQRDPLDLLATTDAVDVKVLREIPDHSEASVHPEEKDLPDPKDDPVIMAGMVLQDHPDLLGLPGHVEELTTASLKPVGSEPWKRGSLMIRFH